MGVTTLALTLAACTVPLGPGFNIEQQSFEVRLLADAPARLHVRAIYRLRNTGNRDLSSMEVLLPDAGSAGRRDLRVFLDGRELAAPSPAAAQSRSIQVPFDPPWPQKQRRELVLEYDLAPAAPGHAGAAVNDNSAHLRRFGWFPELRPPEHLFAQGGDPPEKVRFSIRVPEGFRVLAGGKEKGTHRGAGEVEYRFELRKNDPGPFVIAGRYAEAPVETPHGDVVFWTLQPLPPGLAQQAAARIAASHSTYEDSFGRFDLRRKGLWVVETPAHLTPHTGPGADDAPAGVSFPDGAMLNARAFALGVASDSFLDLVDHELAHAWFGQGLAPRPEAEVLLTEALAEYATLVAAEARDGEPARRRHAALLLRWYDEHRRNYAEKPLVALRPSDPWEQRAFGYSKGALFFVALEDEFGKENVRRGLARMVHALSGNDYLSEEPRAGLHELRAALESETGRDLAEFFRTWLNRTGIPDSFRSRYELKTETKN